MCYPEVERAYEEAEQKRPDLIESMKRVIIETTSNLDSINSRTLGNRILRRKASAGWNAYFGDNRHRAFGIALYRTLIVDGAGCDHSA